MTEQTSKDPLHGVTLEMILNQLVEHYGWEELGAIIRIKCFTVDPSIGSSLTFFRKTSWARTKLERLYLKYKGVRAPRSKSRNSIKIKPRYASKTGFPVNMREKQ